MNHYFAIDIGGTQIKYGLISQNGDVLTNGESDSPTRVTREEFLKKLKNSIEENSDEQLRGIGIATLGTVDRNKGMVTGACNNFQILKDLPIKEELEKTFNLPVSIMNDVDAAALGEAWFGRSKDLDKFYCITYGTGIGGALVINKSVYKGANCAEGEVGYLWKSRGTSYEELASAKSFSDECAKINDGDGRVLAEALKGNPKFRDILEAWLFDVASGIIDIIYMLDPGTVVIGGAVSGIGELFTKRLTAQIDCMILDDYKGKTHIIPATHGNTSNMLVAITPLL